MFNSLSDVIMHNYENFVADISSQFSSKANLGAASLCKGFFFACLMPDCLQTQARFTDFFPLNSMIITNVTFGKKRCFFPP